MTLLIPTRDAGPTGSASAPGAALPAQRPASNAVALDLFAATDAAQRALDGAGRSDRDAVLWLSEHIAALDRVIYPAARRHLTQTEGLRAQQVATHRLAVLVRRLHAHLGGDGAAAREDVPALRRDLIEALRGHSVAERNLLVRLRDELTARQWSELTAQYAKRLQRGPTRPHPHMPRTGAAGRAAYRISTWADHALDVLDSRAVRPLPVPDDAHAA